DEIPEEPLVLWVGRLDPLKNWQAFVELASLIREQRAVRFCLVGGEKAPQVDKDSLLEMLKERDLENVFQWLPSIPHAEMPMVFQRAGGSGGCLVSTSWAESFGLVALEAMACGCPVVVPDVIGLCDVVTEGETGLFYRSGAVKDAVPKILQLLDNGDLRRRLIQGGRKSAQDFTIGRSIDAFADALDCWRNMSGGPLCNGTSQCNSLTFKSTSPKDGIHWERDFPVKQQLNLLQSAMKAYCAQANDYDRLIGERDQVLLTYRAELSLKDARLKELAEKLSESEHTNEFLSQELNTAKWRLNTIYSSLTWKILQTWVRFFHGSYFAKSCECVFKRLLNRDDGRGDKAKESSEDRVEYHDGLLKILDQHKKNRGVIVLPPTIDWNLPLYQRPQHMALHLAKMGYLLFYCTPNYSDNCNGFTLITDNLYLTDQSELLLNHCENLILDLYSTSVSGMDSALKLQKKHTVVYEYIDHIHESIFGTITEVLRSGHQRLNPDIVFASASDLCDEMVQRFGPEKVVYLPNGVDYDHFSVSREKTRIPQDIKGIIQTGNPIVGYFGALAKWLDYDLLNLLAKSRPKYELLIIGVDYDGSLQQLHSLPNVHYLGQKPYKILPNYGAWFDVSIIPFQAGEIADTTSPIKLFEYMALGTPIVTTDMKECKKYRSVLWAKNSQEFIESVDRALELREDRLYLEILNEDARANTWQARAECFDRAIQDIVANS
ncbi:MAG: glycosyltransferase, partial [Desulfoferrobacter sp.]